MSGVRQIAATELKGIVRRHAGAKILSHRRVVGIEANSLSTLLRGGMQEIYRRVVVLGVTCGGTSSLMFEL